MKLSPLKGWSPDPLLGFQLRSLFKSLTGLLKSLAGLLAGQKKQVISYMEREAQASSSHCQETANRLCEFELGASRDFLDSLADKWHTSTLMLQLSSLYAHSAADVAEALIGRKYSLEEANLEEARKILCEALAKAIASEKFFDNIHELLRWQCEQVVEYQCNQINEHKKFLMQALGDLKREEKP